MLYLALFISLVVAATGTYMTSLLIRGRRVPARLALMHGVMALAMLGPVLGVVFLGPHGMLINDAAFMFVAAAVLGVFIFLLGRGGSVPWPLACLHGLVAVIAIGLLMVGLNLA